jgi:branched-chain amino acid transport system permease protein
MSAFVLYLVSGIAFGCSFALVASGLVTIHRVTRVANLAQGTFAIVAGFTASTLLAGGAPHGIAELIGIVVAGLSGLLVGVVAIGKRGTPMLASMVITLGLAILAYAAEVAIWGDQPRSIAGAPGTVTLAGAPIQWQYLVVIAAAGLTLGGLGLFFGYTYLGKAMTACADNPYAAGVVGIDVRRMGLLAFGLGGVLGGIAGVLIAPLVSMSFNSDVELAINGFAAAIVGGLYRPIPALAGGLVLGVAESMVGGYLSPSYHIEVALLMMLALMVWQAGRRSILEEA